jgi:hypothetical protein
MEGIIMPKTINNGWIDKADRSDLDAKVMRELLDYYRSVIQAQRDAIRQLQEIIQGGEK